MNRIPLQEQLTAVEDKHDDDHPYSMPDEIIEKLQVRVKHVLSMNSEEWNDFLRFQAFKVSDFLFGPIKERNTKKAQSENEEKKTGRIFPFEAFHPKNATDGQWVVFEKSVRQLSGDPDLDVARLFEKPLGTSESMNVATDGVSELMIARAKEIKNWFKETEIMKLMMDGLDSMPHINFDFLGKGEKENTTSPYDPTSRG